MLMGLEICYGMTYLFDWCINAIIYLGLTFDALQ